MDYKQAIQFIKNRRKNQLLVAQQRFIAALKSNKDLHDLDVRLRTVMLSDNPDNNEILRLQKQENKMLSLLGIDLNPPPFCTLCNDNGIKNGKACSCVINMTGKGYENFNTFDDSDFSVFPINEQETVKSAYALMRTFCDKFPFTSKNNVLIYGKTGTGKTFLVNCMAAEIAKKGYSVIFLSAFEFVMRMLNYHTSPMESKLEIITPLLDCDLLVIDDLGSESMFKNVTIEYFCNILNERLRNKKHTLITTNLDDALIESRYGLRVASRLFDKRTCLGFALSGTDIRKNF